MNFRTASCAAKSRFGSTSFATIEPDVSMTMTTVACSRGTLRATAGRAIPISATATASAKTSGGMKRRFCAVPLFGSTEASTSRFVKRMA